MSGGAYPITVGTYERPGLVEFRGYSPSRISTPHSLKRIVRTRGAQRWYMKLSYGPMIRDKWEEIVAFLDEQNGQVGKFTIVIPGKESPRGGVSGATQVNGAQAAGVGTVNLKNLPLSITGVFKRGDLITFASHLKVYEVTRTASSDGAGLATVYINCPLLTAITNGSAVTWSSVSMQAALTSDTVPRSWKGGLLSPGFDVEMIEDPY